MKNCSLRIFQDLLPSISRCISAKGRAGNRAWNRARTKGKD